MTGLTDAVESYIRVYVFKKSMYHSLKYVYWLWLWSLSFEKSVIENINKFFSILELKVWENYCNT